MKPSTPRARDSSRSTAQSFRTAIEQRRQLQAVAPTIVDEPRKVRAALVLRQVAQIGTVLLEQVAASSVAGAAARIRGEQLAADPRLQRRKRRDAPVPHHDDLAVDHRSIRHGVAAEAISGSGR
jgi:hypothetical protein